MTSAKWRTSTLPTDTLTCGWGYTAWHSGLSGSVPSRFVFQQTICVLWTAAGLDQSAAGRGRIRAAVQAGGRRCIPVVAKPAGDTATQLERVRLVTGWAEIGAARSAAQV